MAFLCPFTRMSGSAVRTSHVTNNCLQKPVELDSSLRNASSCSQQQVVMSSIQQARSQGGGGGVSGCTARTTNLDTRTTNLLNIKDSTHDSAR
jgi:hypothetical protein